MFTIEFMKMASICAWMGPRNMPPVAVQPAAFTPPPGYEFMALSANGLAFLHGSRFSDALQEPVQRVAILYNVTPQRAIEDLRRFIALKA